MIARSGPDCASDAAEVAKILSASGSQPDAADRNRLL